MPKKLSFIGLGDVHLKKYGIAAPALPIGSCSQVDITINEDVQRQQNYGRDGGTLSSNRRISSIETAIVMQSLHAENIALGTRGSVSDVAGGSATEETHTVYVGGLVRLANVSPTNVVVTSGDGLTTYTDVTVTPGGIVATEGGDLDTAIKALPDPTVGLPIKVSYDFAARRVIEALTKSASEYVLHFDGLNEANTGKPVVVDMWRQVFGPAETVSLVGDEYGSLSVPGELLLDPSRTGVGESKFFTYNYVE